jgi:transposase-like protein
MPTKRVRHTPDLKAKVAMEAIKGQKTLNEISSLYGVHANQILRWKYMVRVRCQAPQKSALFYVGVTKYSISETAYDSHFSVELRLPGSLEWEPRSRC